MTDEFLTEGLRDDRYLKAVRLMNQFEDEIEARLLQLDQRLVDAQPGLFESDVKPDTRTNRTPGNGLTLHRVNHSMTGPQVSDDGKTQKLNVHLYWMPPTEYNRTDVDGALRAFGYKVKHADTSVDDRVAAQTRGGEWPLETSGNPYDPNTVFYSEVSSASEIEETADTLVTHFTEFGDEYATN